MNILPSQAAKGFTWVQVLGAEQHMRTGKVGHVVMIFFPKEMLLNPISWCFVSGTNPESLNGAEMGRDPDCWLSCGKRKGGKNNP